jgi:hypothetical protein
LTPERAEEIFEGLTTMQGTFACHKTTKSSKYDDSEMVATEKSEHCAGALIMLEHMELPNQLMRIAERLGHYDRAKLDMDAPVFTDGEDFIDWQAA